MDGCLLKLKNLNSALARWGRERGGDALSYFHSVHAIFTTVALAQAGVGRRPTIKNVEFAVVKLDAEV